MCDYLGQTLSVGDAVVFIHRTDTSAFFVRAVVVGFTGRTERKQVELRTVSEYHSKIVRVFPHTIIKIDNIGG